MGYSDKRGLIGYRRQWIVRSRQYKGYKDIKVYNLAYKLAMEIVEEKVLSENVH